MRLSRAPMLASAVALVLSACGGGGDSSPTAPTGTTGNSPIDAARAATVIPAAGDWSVYTFSRQASPSPAATETLVHSVASGSTEGAYTRVETGTYHGRETFNFGADGTLQSSTSLQQCTLSPGLRTAPSRQASIGSVWSGSSTKQCVVTPTKTPLSVITVSITGKVESLENRTVPAGTFATLRYTSTQSEVFETYTVVTEKTCWMEQGTGRMIECDSTEKYLYKVPQPTPAAPVRTRLWLEATGIDGGESVGPSIRRFVGSWPVSFSGSDSGSCSPVMVDADGNFSGTCYAGGGRTRFTIKGAVNAQGVLNATASTGAVFTGNLISPREGNGTWVMPSGAQGSWTATHF